MSSNIIHDPSFPHGKYGYILGCHGSHCPADVACRDVHLRYSGDFAFRRLIDAGHTPADIIKAEQEALQQAQDARKHATRVHVPKVPRKTRTQAPAGQHASSYTTAIRRHHAQGMLDHEISAATGLGRRQVTTIRNAIGLTPNRTINNETVRRLHADGYTDTQIAQHINHIRKRTVNRRAVAAVRLRLGLTPNPAPVNTTGASSLPKEAT